MTLQGHPRSLILAPIESAYRTSYLSSILNTGTSSHVLETGLSELLYAEGHISVPHHGQNFGCFPWNRSVMLWSAESEHPELTIAVKLFSKNSNLCDHDTSSLPTDGRTDRRLAVAVPRGVHPPKPRRQSPFPFLSLPVHPLPFISALGPHGCCVTPKCLGRNIS